MLAGRREGGPAASPSNERGEECDPGELKGSRCFGSFSAAAEEHIYQDDGS